MQGRLPLSRQQWGCSAKDGTQTAGISGKDAALLAEGPECAKAQRREWCGVDWKRPLWPGLESKPRGAGSEVGARPLLGIWILISGKQNCTKGLKKKKLCRLFSTQY